MYQIVTFKNINYLDGFLNKAAGKKNKNKNSETNVNHSA